MLNVQLIYDRKTNGESVHGDTDFSDKVPFAEKRSFILDSLDELLRNGKGKLVIELGEDEFYFPQTEETAKLCVHLVRCWYGHECGFCEESPEGYRWYDFFIEKLDKRK